MTISDALIGLRYYTAIFFTNSKPPALPEKPNPYGFADPSSLSNATTWFYNSKA